MEFYLLIFNTIVVITVLLIVIFRKNLKNEDTGSEERIISIVKEELTETRRENRELNKENRQEINTMFKELQDSLLKRISENISLQKEQLDSFSRSLNELSEKLLKNYNDFRESAKNDSKDTREEVTKALKSFEVSFGENIKLFNEQLRERFDELSKQQLEFNKQSNISIKDIRESVEKQLVLIREDNTNQLNEMRKTVDEKLQTTLEKRLGESFKQVSERLEMVHKGLGEMQKLATGVGDLQKVLSNVKTRGILGEYQLGNILEQLLSPDQYAENVATKKGSQANVEYAIKLPGKVDDSVVWLPIDSKFPIESYQLLLEAYDDGNTVNIDSAQKVLLRSIELFAKTISEKYIDPPHTTDFAIMFLPVESLYAEVLRHPGTFEKLQRDYHITVTGPTTLSALLNSLQMGFRTLAVQKSEAVKYGRCFPEVKTEFGKFSEHLEKVHKQLNTATITLDTLRNRRTNALERKLRSVESLETENTQENMELPLSTDNDN